MISLSRIAAAITCGALTVVCLACGGHAPQTRTARPILRELHATTRGVSPTKSASSLFTPLPTAASKVTFARMAKHIEPGWNVPRGVQHAPPVGPERLVTFLASETGDETMSLFAFDTTTGKSEVILRAKDLGDGGAVRSREEELRRERQRDRNEGITSHLWAKKAKLLVIPHGGDIFVRDFAREPTGAVRRLTKTTEAEIDPKPCETGERIAFVRKGELFSIDVATGKETALTTPAANPKSKEKDGDGITHGLSDYVAQEELGESSGFFWSPKCDRLVYLEVDDRPVDKIPVLGYRGEADLMMQRYPRAGAKNPAVRVGVLELATKKTTWLGWKGNEGERYYGRFAWSDDGKALYLQTLTRDQKRLALVRVDPHTGATTEIATETNPAWVTFASMKLLKNGESFVFSSTKTGHRHLEVRSAKDGAVQRTLTSGDWDVEGIAGLDEAGGKVLFGGTKESPLERHLYTVPLAGGAEPTRLTNERGVHSARVDESGTTWVDVHSSSTRPPKGIVVRDGKVAGELPIPPDPEIEGLRLRPVEHVTIKAADGETLHGALLKPRELKGAEKHPAVVMVYGGPESQTVYDSWSPHLMWQHLADRGFVVFQLDNRGTGGRGRAVAQKVHKKLGKLELEDQIAGAAWLGSQPFIDGARIGIYGHSYGGFMAALAMLEGKGAFKAGVAGSPVTDWRLYDTGYTERYMETPQTNAAGYEASDLAKKASGLTGKLLLTHAMMDENVHYAHTARLVDALIAADKRFDLLVLPGERHGLRAPPTRVYMPERIVEYFVDNL
jgi:dipeptidyl-peptidase 4